MGLKNIFKDLLSPLGKTPAPTDLEKSSDSVIKNNQVLIAKSQNKSQTIRKPKAKSQQQARKKDFSKMKIFTINNQAIRMFTYGNQQYYCVDDIAKASRMTGPEQFLKDYLARNPKINSELVEVETKEDGKNTILQFATKEQMMPIVDDFEKVSPKTIIFSVKSLN